MFEKFVPESVASSRECILTGTEFKSSNIIADNERGHLDFGGLPSKSNHLNVHV